MKRFKCKILQWLGIYKLITEHELLMRSLNVGVDVHLKGNSWAVICLDGNPSYIKFISLGKTDLTDIRNFLRQYQKSNNIIDAPPMLRMGEWS